MELEIVDQLMKAIHTRQLQADEQLPSENELADHYRVPRITVRKAYKRLQEMGYIYSLQGKGSYVNNRQQQIPLLLSGDESFSEKMKKHGYDYDSKNVLFEKMIHNDVLFRRLGLQEPDQIYQIGRLRFLDQKPIALHISFVAQSVFPTIEQDGEEITSMFQYYRRQGFQQFSSSQTTLRIQFPTKAEREWLDCPISIPALVVETDCRDRETGTILEYTKIFYRSDYFTYCL
ncbi:transcriptional regulator [Bacillaceae bacterium SAS-127]|nr:transcriptional regulator [Bacillaceae bacterium SAS-127]